MVPRETGTHPATMEAYFHELADALDGMVHAGETGLAWLAAESTDFVRMNRGKVRQPGSVVQRYLDVGLVNGARQATRQLSLSGDVAADRERIAAAIGEIRSTLPDLADDPHLLIATVPQSSRAVRGGPLPDAEEIVATVLADADGLDLVGLYAGGPVYRGFANSLGQRNWHEATAFNLQWSLYHRADKAVKSGLSGFTWDAGRVRRENGRGARATCPTSRGRRRRSRRAITASTSRRRRSRRSRRCFAGADSRPVYWRPSRAASRGCAATVRTASCSIRASR